MSPAPTCGARRHATRRDSRLGTAAPLGGGGTEGGRVADWGAWLEMVAGQKGRREEKLEDGEGGSAGEGCSFEQGRSCKGRRSTTSKLGARQESVQQSIPWHGIGGFVHENCAIKKWLLLHALGGQVLKGHREWGDLRSD
eukprot:29555-Pleurochrysis_carterae.AAC.5